MTAVISESHGFGTDALLLSNFARPGKKSVCCDFGTGCGIIPLLWCRGECGPITAVELQEQGCAQLEKAIELSHLEGKINVINGDLRSCRDYLEAGSCDIVTMNPPYKAENHGIESRDEAKKIARHGITCGLDDICAAASRVLKFGGRLCMCIRPERLSELFEEMIKAGIEPKRLRLVAKNPGKAPWLCLVEGRRGGKKGMTVEANLFIYGENGEYSDELKEMYKDYLFENRGD